MNMQLSDRVHSFVVVMLLQLTSVLTTHVGLTSRVLSTCSSSHLLATW
jgi:hypothetical protein